MDGLVTAALVGTARQSAPPAEGDAPTDAVVARVPDLTAERRILLRAGALVAYRLAGQPVAAAMDALEAAPPEARAACAPEAAALIGGMLEGQYAELLPEALERLRQAGQILPPALLLVALNLRTPVLAAMADARPALAAALGERGRWLASLNPEWQWVRDALGEREPPPADARAIWDDGLPKARRAIFRRMRAADPATARAWLAEAWPHEKADIRADLVQLLAIGLVVEDEPLLTQALADRAESVRMAAARLLARLPESPLAVRLMARADTLLSYADDKLRAKPPTTLPAEWQRDGIIERARHGMGKRAWWLMQALMSVPPGHWQQRFGAPPARLIAAARASDYAAALIEGWSRAALHFRDAAWAEALWEWWLVPRNAGALAGDDLESLRDEVGALVPRAVAEARVGRLLEDPNDPAHAEAGALVAALPMPWSAAFGARYLSALRAAAGNKRADPDDWADSMQAAIQGLPPPCLAAALTPWRIHDPKHKIGVEWQERLDVFTEALGMRQRLVAAIPVEQTSAE